ncbi:MAG: hypothetical protein PVJ64_07210 [Gemmatimonadales bacterium]|jgi:hypothetical protein
MSRPLRLDRWRASDGDGFTVIELLIYLVVGVVVIGFIYQVLIGQHRLYMKQQELMDVRSSLRAAAALLTWELRQASALDGDLYTIASNSIALRSIQGAGIVCGADPTNSHYGLWGTSGEFNNTPDDSALVFAAGGPSAADDYWLVVSMADVSGNVPCDWGGGVQPEVLVEATPAPDSGTPPDWAAGEITVSAKGNVSPGATVKITASYPALTCDEFGSQAMVIVYTDESYSSGVMDGCTFSVTIPTGAEELYIQIEVPSTISPNLSDDIYASVGWELDDEEGGGGGGSNDGADVGVLESVHVGAPFRAFRRVQYGLFQEDGRWWLGRMVGSASSFEKLIGPLAAPSDSGLVFTYYDLAGNATADPRQVAVVEIVLRAESFGKVQTGTGDVSVQQDNLTTAVKLRG